MAANAASRGCAGHAWPCACPLPGGGGQTCLRGIASECGLPESSRGALPPSGFRVLRALITAAAQAPQDQLATNLQKRCCTNADACLRLAATAGPRRSRQRHGDCSVGRHAPLRGQRTVAVEFAVARHRPAHAAWAAAPLQEPVVVPAECAADRPGSTQTEAMAGRGWIDDRSTCLTTNCHAVCPASCESENCDCAQAKRRTGSGLESKTLKTGDFDGQPATALAAGTLCGAVLRGRIRARRLSEPFRLVAIVGYKPARKQLFFHVVRTSQSRMYRHLYRQTGASAVPPRGEVGSFHRMESCGSPAARSPSARQRRT